MENLRRLIREHLNRDFITAALSHPRTKGSLTKVKVRPVLKQDTLFFQFEEFRGAQVFHRNLEPERACEEMLLYLREMRQMQMDTRDRRYTVLVSKKGRATIRESARKDGVKAADLSHNRKKHYILEEGMQVPFLQDLGVMTRDGRVVHARFDKFRQVNRFLEFIEDILPALERDREITILDFGCGKSYLTFAMYYYLRELKHYDIRIIGLDLKADVIRRCNELSEKYGYEKLTFLEGDIADYEGTGEIDLVVTLHACDTATDYALANAVKWKAKVILSVPCCQHELNPQLENDVLRPVLKYGLLRERFAAILTDALRAEYLEREGYDTQILEFIDMEHTPKNLLIRAVRTGRKRSNGEEIRACEEAFHVSPALGKLLR